MTGVPCVLCGVDSIATCLACQQRVCNRHLILSVGSLNHYASVTQVDWSATPVALVHPQGETSTSVTGGAYLAAFAGGSPRCLACREHDGQEALTASRDPSADAGKGERYVDLATARASTASRAQDQESRQQATELAAARALRQMDERSSEATAAFLPMAAGIELQRIVTDKRWIPEKRRFGMQVTEGRWDTDFVEGHVIYHSSNDNSERGLRFDWTLFMLPDGRINFMEIKDYNHPCSRDDILAETSGRRPDGYEVDFEKKGGPLYRAGNFVWIRKDPSPGLLPCYRDHDKLTPRIPGHEYSDYYDGAKVVRVCHETAVWFVGALASYLESHTAKP